MVSVFFPLENKPMARVHFLYTIQLTISIEDMRRNYIIATPKVVRNFPPSKILDTDPAMLLYGGV